jgi:hypothetical protein
MADPVAQGARGVAAETVAAERLQQAATYIEAEESATNRYGSRLAGLATVLLVGMSLFHLYASF